MRITIDTEKETIEIEEPIEITHLITMLEKHFPITIENNYKLISKGYTMDIPKPIITSSTTLIPDYHGKEDSTK